MLAQHMSEKGVLQMLLDVRFLRASLAEGHPRSAAGSAPQGSAAQAQPGPTRLARDDKGPGRQLQDWFQGLETTLQVLHRCWLHCSWGWQPYCGDGDAADWPGRHAVATILEVLRCVSVFGICEPYATVRNCAIVRLAADSSNHCETFEL